MRDPKYQGRGSPDTTYGKRFDAVEEVPEPPTLSDITPRNWEQMIPPGAGFDASLQRRGLEWIRKQAAREGCLGVFTSHDPDLPPQTVEIPMLDHD